MPSTEPRRQWAFTWASDRGDDEIDILWDLFAKGVDFAEGAAPESDFVAALDRGLTVHTWELATGLYRARPMSFPPLDGPSRKYAQVLVDMEIPSAAGRRRAEDYMTLRDRLLEHFDKPESVITNFVEFSMKAFSATQPEPRSRRLIPFRICLTLRHRSPTSTPSTTSWPRAAFSTAPTSLRC